MFKIKGTFLALLVLITLFLKSPNFVLANEQPFFLANFEDITMNINDGDHAINLLSFVKDLDEDTVTLSIIQQNYESLNHELSPDGYLTLKAKALGTTTFTVFATDNKSSQIQQSFKVTVVDEPKQNTAPIITGRIKNEILRISDPDYTINLLNHFNDLEDKFDFTITQDNNNYVAYQFTDDGKLILTPKKVGTTNFTVKADDKHFEPLLQSFTITVKEDYPPNRPPEPMGKIKDITISKIGYLDNPIKLKLSDYFFDLDGDLLSFSLVQDNYDSLIHQLTLEENLIVIETKQPGTTRYTINATDRKSKAVTQTFTVTVLDILDLNRSPEPKGKIKDINISKIGYLDNPVKLNLSDYFLDRDGDPLSFSVIQDNYDVLIYELTEEGNFNIIETKQPGTTKFTINATDRKSKAVTQTFTVKVLNEPKTNSSNPTSAKKNNPPVPVDKINNVNIKEVGYLKYPITLTLSDYFSDSDGDLLSFSLVQDNYDSLIHQLTEEGNLIIIETKKPGTTKFTINATDKKSKAVTQTFIVSVKEIDFSKYKLMSERQIDISAKKLKIPFTLPLKKETVNNESVFLLNEDNQSIPIVLEQQGNILSVSLDDYIFKAGERYTLYIDNSIQSIENKSVSNASKFIFNVSNKVKQVKEDQNEFIKPNELKNYKEKFAPISDVKPTDTMNISFSTKLNPTTVNDKTVFIIDENNKKVSIAIELVDGNKINFVPLQPYSVGRKYDLFITDGVKSISGAKSIEPIKFSFKTTE